MKGLNVPSSVKTRPLYTMLTGAHPSFQYQGRGASNEQNGLKEEKREEETVLRKRMRKKRRRMVQ